MSADVGMTQAWKLICLVFLSAAIVGCGAKPVTVLGNEELVQQAVTESLQAWKDGKDPAEFTRPDSKVIIADEEWQGGAKLLDFSLPEKPTLNGSHWRQKVELKIGKGKPKVIYYAVTLGKPTSILRSDFLH